jgi:6-phosphogluconolactonase (cycloisomerase 2 family)
VSEVDSFNSENGGALFAVDTAPEKMHLLDIKSTHGKHPCHLYIKENYTFIAFARELIYNHIQVKQNKADASTYSQGNKKTLKAAFGAFLAFILGYRSQTDCFSHDDLLRS